MVKITIPIVMRTAPQGYFPMRYIYAWHSGANVCYVWSRNNTREEDHSLSLQLASHLILFSAK